jgi:hypothetical protein
MFRTTRLYFTGIALALLLLASILVTPQSASAGACFNGVRKGVVWDGREWHHYVDFAVNVSAPDNLWRITSAPLPSSMWPGYYDRYYKRAGYSWPSNWWDPFSASSWRICY